MTKRLILLGPLVPALLLGGCMGTQNRGLESVHQPVVSRSDYALDLVTAGGGLAPGELQRLAGWMGSLRVSYGDHVAIDTAGGPLPRVRDQVAALVASRGLLLSEDAPVSAAPITPGTVRIILSRMTASVPGCPDWSRDESHEFNSNTSSNYGCASNATLAAMIARPEDLVHGRSSDGIDDTLLSAKAITNYRKGTSSAGQALKIEHAGGN